VPTTTTTNTGYSTSPRRDQLADSDRLVAREIVRSLAPLLHDVVRWIGGVGTDDLMANLRATLATGGPESALPLDAVAGSQPARQELRQQAATISERLISWIAADLAALIASPDDHTEPVFTRSRCDGHPWTPQVQRLLMGPRGGPESMQGYNQFLHQMVLLRDALLPFTNWEQVPVLVDGTGLRRLDGARETFGTEMIMRQVRATALVDFARLVVEGKLGPHGYGFTSPHGTVLPTVVGSDVGTASPRLLSWHAPDSPTVPRPGTGAAATAVYALDDYFAAPRTPASAVSGPAQPQAKEATATSVARAVELVVAPGADPTTSSFGLSVSPEDIAVDLGQAVRGHRYAYRAPDGEHSARDEGVQMLDARAVLAAPGLVWEAGGTWAVSAGHNPTLALALLGKLYPENVVLVPGSTWGDLRGVGKDGTASFLVLDVAED